MDLAVKRILHLRFGAGKNDLSMVGRNFVDVKPVPGQPAGNSGQILLAGAEAGSVLGRRKPLVVESRVGIVLRFHQRLQRCLLCCRRLELKHHLFQRRLPHE